MNDVYFRNPKIYIVSGKARNGKDTFSGYLKEEYEKNNKKAIVTSFAKYIKYYAMEMTGWDLKDETKPRELLQKLGTDVIRKQLGKEMLFINRMYDDIEIYSYFYDAVIISDARFPVEIDSIKNKFNNSVSIKVFRPNFDNGLTEEQKMHPTEVALDNYNSYDDIVINTTLDNLKNITKDIYNKYRKEE